MTDLDLDAIEQRAAAATKGPWRVDEMDMYIFGRDGHMVASNCPTEDRWQVRGAGAEGSGQRPKGSQDANAEFIAHAREDVPALAAEVRRLRQLVCTCGSGGHPRKCLRHPEAFEEHCEELSLVGQIDDLCAEWRERAARHEGVMWANELNGYADELEAVLRGGK